MFVLFAGFVRGVEENCMSQAGEDELRRTKTERQKDRKTEIQRKRGNDKKTEF